MAIHAYDEMYLLGAQHILGDAVDFAILSLEIESDVFEHALSIAASAKQFGEGNPKYIAGMNGCEFAREVLEDAHIEYPDVEDAMYLDKSPEYWAGWALAYYQWFSNKPFSEILQTVSLQQIIDMYPVYHEMDIAMFVDQLDRLLK